MTDSVYAPRGEYSGHAWDELESDAPEGFCRVCYTRTLTNGEVKTGGICRQCEVEAE